MSLINEALKRTERDKLNKSSSAGDVSALEPIGDNRMAGKRRSVMLALVGGAAAVVLVTGWMAIRKGTGGAGTDAAAGDVRPAPPVAHLGRATHRTPVAAPDRSQAGIDREIHQAIAETLLAVKYYDPSVSPTTKPHAVESPGAAGDKSQVNPLPKDIATKPATAAASPAEAPPQPTPPPAPKPKLRESDFKLSGIMRGPDGTVAIINGRYVRVGQTVSGAKVVNIGHHSVELEADGQRLIIQM